MHSRITTLLGFLSAGVITLGAVKADALAIQYQALNLADVTPGKDLWRYSYQVTGYNFQAGEGFDIYFLQSQYRNLSNPQPDNGPNWYVASSVGPGVGAPLIYDAITIVPDSTAGVFFTVDFEWLGSGTPGSQPFEAFRPAAAGGIENFDGGLTQVPEAGPSLLMAALAFGAVSFPLLRRKTR